jgi:hypothetical protein
MCFVSGAWVVGGFFIPAFFFFLIGRPRGGYFDTRETKYKKHQGYPDTQNRRNPARKAEHTMDYQA